MAAMMLSRPAARRSLRLAFAASLALHLALLLAPVTPPVQRSAASGSPPPSRLQGQLRPPSPASRATPTTPPDSSKPVVAVTGKNGARRVHQSARQPAPPRWSAAEKADMNRFLNELGSPARPRTAQEMVHNALATAREIGREQARSEEAAGHRQGSQQPVNRLSMELYFDALVKKLNRSAAFVKDEPRSKGVKAAAVQIQLNADGSLHSFRILSATDQQSEIAYIKQVVERAVPFAALPGDLRQELAGNSGGPAILAILICIQPSYLGGGFGFTRTANGRDCRE